DHRRMCIKLAAGTAILSIIFVMALAGVLLPPDDAMRIALAARLQPPAPEHLLGTDSLGRDVLSRLLVGTEVTVRTTTAAMLVAFAAGLPLGWLAASFPRWLGAAVSVIAYVFFVAPPQLLVPTWSSRILMASCCGSLILPGTLIATGIAT